MDYLKGGDLRYHIAKNKFFTEKQTKFFLSNIIIGLSYIHSKNIIHRDIKPENLVCDSNGYVRITDFGVAKKNEKDNSSETSGTPGYMAPEVMLLSNHSFPVDYYAIGIIGFEFCFGFRPYLGRSRKEIRDLIVSRQVKINNDDIPDDWSIESADFINQLIERKECKRLGFKNGIKDLMEHKWMKDVDWDKIRNKELIVLLYLIKKKIILIGNIVKVKTKLIVKLYLDIMNILIMNVFLIYLKIILLLIIFLIKVFFVIIVILIIKILVIVIMIIILKLNHLVILIL